MANISDLFDSSGMPNDYFKLQQEYSNDKTLYDSLITEAYNKFGVPVVYYITTFDITHDKIFGEDTDRYVVRKFDCQLYFELPEEAEQYGNFAIEGLDSFIAYASKAHFQIASTYAASSSGENTYSSHVPKEGDLFKAKYNDYWYEIVQVKEKDEQFLQGQHAYSFNVRPMKDEHLSISATLSGDEIENHMDVDPDVFSISAAIDERKDDVLFNTSGDDVSVSTNDPFGSW